MAVPGALKGYRLGKKLMQHKKIKEVLSDAYSGESTPTPPLLPSDVTLKTAALDPGFEEILDELKDEKKKGLLQRKDVKLALRDLQAGRRRQFKVPHYSLSQVEKQLLHKELGPELFKAPKMLNTPRSSLPSGLKFLVKQNPKTFAIMGGLAALSALGLTAAQVQKYRKQNKSSPLLKK
jgi:hypothetical protein